MRFGRIWIQARQDGQLKAENGKLTLRIESDRATETTAASKQRTEISSQRLRHFAVKTCAEGSGSFAPQSESRSVETRDLCRPDWTAGESSIRKSQERLQISAAGQEIRPAIIAGVVRASESDAVRARSANGKRFGRRSPRRRLRCGGRKLKKK